MGSSYPDTPDEIRQILDANEQILYAMKESKAMSLRPLR